MSWAPRKTKSSTISIQGNRVTEFPECPLGKYWQD
jgi:hypothetical protein